MFIGWIHYNSITQVAAADYHLGKQQWGLFAQDSWKITRKITLDYGLRYDYGTVQTEQDGRVGVLGAVPNPSAGDRIGGTIYGATCHCSFENTYPYAFGPRLGLAYQVIPKTVIRAGIGLLYSFVPDLNAGPPLTGINQPGGLNPYVALAGGTAIPQPTFPDFNPGVYPTVPGSTNSAPAAVDINAGRPPRQLQYSIGLQREISRDFVLGAAYVGNRGVWWTTAGANLGLLEQISPATFAAYGLNPYTNPADDALLSQSASSAAAVQRFGHALTPYAGFNGTVLQALEAYPQFSTAGLGGTPLTMTNAPTGNTYYDSLQMTGTKRLSHGLQVNGTFTWSKALVSTREDFWNPASSSKTYQSTDQPFLFNSNIVYTVPKVLESFNKVVSQLARDWQVGVFLQYGSGFLLTPPTVTNGGLNPLTQVEGGTSYMLRVPGQPLYLKNPNCGCINPYDDQILNPAAWENPAAGQWGGNAYYGDFRGGWRPQENFNFGRNFRIRENMNFQIRAEFVNIFNRTYLGYPSTTYIPVSRNPAGQITGGFGTVNETLAPYSYSLPSAPANQNGVCSGDALCGLPRTGTLIGRFSF